MQGIVLFQGPHPMLDRSIPAGQEGDFLQMNRSRYEKSLWLSLPPSLLICSDPTTELTPRTPHAMRCALPQPTAS
jgi:hypothetical protein